MSIHHALLDALFMALPDVCKDVCFLMEEYGRQDEDIYCFDYSVTKVPGDYGPEKKSIMASRYNHWTDTLDPPMTFDLPHGFFDRFSIFEESKLLLRSNTSSFMFHKEEWKQVARSVTKQLEKKYHEQKAWLTPYVFILTAPRPLRHDFVLNEIKYKVSIEDSGLLVLEYGKVLIWDTYPQLEHASMFSQQNIFCIFARDKLYILHGGNGFMTYCTFSNLEEGWKVCARVSAENLLFLRNPVLIDNFIFSHVVCEKDTKTVKYNIATDTWTSVDMRHLTADKDSYPVMTVFSRL